MAVEIKLKHLSRFKVTDTRENKQYTIVTQVKGDPVLIGWIDSGNQIQMISQTWDSTVDYIRKGHYVITEEIKF